MNEKSQLTRQFTAIEKDRSSCMRKLATCFKPLFVSKVIYLDLKYTIWCNFLLMVLFIVLGVVIREGTTDTKSFQIRFDDKCGDSQTCEFPFFVKSRMKGPIYVYLHFKNFYVQHRKSLKSVDYDQLKGERQSAADVKTSCEGMVTNEDFVQDFSITGNKLDPKAALSPCGLYASLFPRDRFTLEKKNTGDTYSKVDITANGISWEDHRTTKFKQIDGGKEQWVDVTDGTLHSHRTLHRVDATTAAVDLPEALGQDRGSAGEGRVPGDDPER